MDLRTRILMARLAVRIEDNKEYSRKIGITNISDQRKSKGRKEER